MGNEIGQWHEWNCDDQLQWELLDNESMREPADRLLQKMCKEDGMWSIRAWWVYVGLRIGGDPASDPDNIRPITKAPKAFKKNT